MMSHWERKWDSAQAYLSLPVCRGFDLRVLTAGPARMTEYFPIELPFPRALPIKTTDEFGAYARRIYASLGLGASA
jgi:hypothetical protein